MFIIACLDYCILNPCFSIVINPHKLAIKFTVPPSDVNQSGTTRMLMISAIFLIVISFLLLAHVWLRGSQQPEFQEPDDPSIRQFFATRAEDKAALDAVHESVRNMTRRVGAKVAKRDTQGAREVIDSLSDGQVYPCEFTATSAHAIPAEWVTAPDSNPDRRLLYIHGGGFKFGSPKSHRTNTSKFAELAGCAVLSIDYRMLPEHRLKDAISDCRNAYQWILENGPNGAATAQQIFVAGDSAGGNL